MLKKNINYALLIFVFLYINVIGGILVTYGLLTQSTFFLLLVPILLLFLNGIKIYSKIFFCFILTIIYLLLIKFLKDSSIINLINYFAFSIFPLLIFYLVDINKLNIEKKSFRNLLKFTLYLQFPFLIIQILFYSQLHDFAAVDIIREDYTTGTFWMRNDPALNFFLLMLLNTVLYNKKNIAKQSHSYILLILCVIGILISNSKIGLLCLIISLLIYFIKYSNIKYNIKYLIIIIPIMIIIIYIFNDIFLSKFNILISRLTNVSEGAIENFYSGKYSRVVALLYFAKKPINLLGDGMGKYLDMSSMEYSLGLQGQSLLMYAEIGLIGILIFWSYIIILAKALIKRFRRVHIVLISILLMFTLTARPFTDISILLSFFSFIVINRNQPTGKLIIKNDR